MRLLKRPIFSKSPLVLLFLGFIIAIAGGCATSKNMSHPAELARYYATHYPEMPGGREADDLSSDVKPASAEEDRSSSLKIAPEPEKDVQITDDPDWSICSWICSILPFCSDSEHSEAVEEKKEELALPLENVTPKAKPPAIVVIPHWKKSAKHRKKNSLFIEYTPRGVKDNRVFHNIRRIGVFLKNDMTLSIEHGEDDDVDLPNLPVRKMSINNVRIGFLLRKFMDNSFYIHFGIHDTWLCGDLYFNDEDYGGINNVHVSSATQTLAFGIGNQWYITRNMTVGLDWFSIPLIMSRHYTFNAPVNGHTAASRDLRDKFRERDPIGEQTRLWGGLIINLGVAF